MSFNQQQIDALQAAISQGALKVKYQDREVQYRSLDEMLQILNMMQNSVNNTSGKLKIITPEFDKGLC